MIDKAAKISPKRPQDQQLEKNVSASFILTGANDLYIENPAMVTPVPISPTTIGAKAAAANGDREDNAVKKANIFFRMVSFRGS